MEWVLSKRITLSAAEPPYKHSNFNTTKQQTTEPTRVGGGIVVYFQSCQFGSINQCQFNWRYAEFSNFDFTKMTVVNNVLVFFSVVNLMIL